MSFIVRNKTSGPAVAVLIDDLGIEIPAGADYDMLDEAANDVQSSGQTGGDLNDAITNGQLVVLNPKDGVSELLPAESILVTQLHNDPNWGINGAVINDLDDVDTTGAVTGDVLQIGGAGDFTVVTPSVLAGDIALGDLSDVTDGTGKVLGEFYILQGDGAGNHVMVEGSTDNAVFVPFLEDTTGNVVGGGVQTDLTFTYNAATNKMDVSVDDNFLKNTGDTLDSGTLNIASGASISIATGAVLTIADAPVNANDAANKAYVDSVAQGTDIKDSVHHATTPGGGDIGGTYNPTGGTGGTGAITGANSVLDGLSVDLNDRIIIKDQTDAKQNGIYIVTALGGSPTVTMDIERAPDHDGNPTSEVSAGNLAFVEVGNVNGNTSWIVTGSGTLTLNVDDINWTQFAGSGSFTAGQGLGLNGSEFFLDVNNLTGITAVGSDELAFNDVTDNTTKKRSFDNIITDLGIYTDGNLTASDGVLITAGGDIQLDITNLVSGGTPSLLAEMVFDAGGTGTHNKATVGDFFNGLDVPYGITATGFVARIAEDSYASRTLTASVVAGEEGGVITDGDGILGNPTIGVDVTGLTASSNIMATTDEMLMFDGTNNVKVTGQQMADGVSAILGGLGNAYTTIQGDTGSATAGSSTDTLAFLGATNGGITTLATDSAPDTVTFALDIPDLSPGAGPVALIDSIGVGQLNTVRYTFQDIVDDLGIPNGIGALTGILVGDGTGNYVARTMTAAGVGVLDGLSVTDGDGVAANPIVGLDINGTALAGEELAAADKVIVYNDSGTANEAFTGQEVADGVSTMLGFGGLSVSTINGQEVLTLIDTTRANKVLSVGDTSVTWSENKIGNNDWFQIGGAVDAKSGYVVPLNATIVKVTGHSADNKGNSKPILLYVDGALDSTIATFTGTPSGEEQFFDATLDIDVTQGQKLRIRGGSGGRIEDTVITVWLKWHLI